MLRRWNIHHTNQEARFCETSLEYCKIEIGNCKYAREFTNIGDCKNARECTRDTIYTREEAPVTLTKSILH
jgi:hypothetical protein